MKIEIAGVVRDETVTAELVSQAFGLIEAGMVPFAVLTDEEGHSVTFSKSPQGWLLERHEGQSYFLAEIPNEQSAKLGAWWLHAAEGGENWVKGLHWTESEAPKLADEDRPASVLATDKGDKIEQPDQDAILETLRRLQDGDIGRVQLKSTFNRSVQALMTPEGTFALAAYETAGLNPIHLEATAATLAEAAEPFLSLATGEAEWLAAGDLPWQKLGSGKSSTEAAKGGCLGVIALGLMVAVAFGAGAAWLI